MPGPPSAGHDAAAPTSRNRSRSGARPRTGDRGPRDRGLRDLVGAGPSQVGVSGALRARDVNRPTDDDLAEAERTVQIVRRHWKPDA
jgi:hypothetical protein